MKLFHSVGNFLTRLLGRFGSSEGAERGPDAGDGAVIHDSSGEADFDGLPGNVLPPFEEGGKDRNRRYPPKRFGD
jgi:hypothetical protein